MPTSALIGDPDVRFVVMAGCGRLDVFNVAGGLRALARRPQGRVLSIYDRTDTEAGPCARYFTGAPGLVFTEIVLDVGLGHALFYTPERAWVDRVVEFALGRKALGTHSQLRTASAWDHPEALDIKGSR